MAEPGRARRDLRGGRVARNRWGTRGVGEGNRAWAKMGLTRPGGIGRIPGLGRMTHDGRAKGRRRCTRRGVKTHAPVLIALTALAAVGGALLKIGLEDRLGGEERGTRRTEPV
jgi:hypothetical protein